MKTPEIITRYLDAANRFDVTGAANCFHVDAHVHDENHDYAGLDAVRDWIADTSRKYRPRLEVLTAKAQDDTWLLTVRVSGNFPGSPVELDYAITLRDAKISSLKIE
jgi:hypothetical protein